MFIYEICKWVDRCFNACLGISFEVYQANIGSSIRAVDMGNTLQIPRNKVWSKSAIKIHKLRANIGGIKNLRLKDWRRILTATNVIKIWLHTLSLQHPNSWSNFEKVKNKTAKVKFVLQHFQTYGFYPNNFIKYAVHNRVNPDTDTSAQIRSLSSSGF